MGYRINGYTFYTKEQDGKSVQQNSGITLVAEAMHVSSAKDKNPIYARMHYYGVIKEIWDLDYTSFKIPVLECDWVDNNNGVQVDSFGFTLVDLSRVGHKDDPFILASQAKQVFYVADPSSKRWSVVIPGRRKSVINDDDDNEIVVDSLFSQIPHIYDPNSEEMYARDDHNEGIWIDDMQKRSRTIT